MIGAGGLHPLGYQSGHATTVTLASDKRIPLGLCFVFVLAGSSRGTMKLTAEHKNPIGKPSVFWLRLFS